MNKKTLVFDFDGVIHSYRSGWKGVDIIPDPPVPGMREAMLKLKEKGYEIVIVSTRSATPEGIAAMVEWLCKHDFEMCYDKISTVKPPAFCYIDDRAICFDGDPKRMLTEIEVFKPWNDPSRELFLKKWEEDL